MCQELRYVLRVKQMNTRNESLLKIGIATLKGNLIFTVRDRKLKGISGDNDRTIKAHPKMLYVLRGYGGLSFFKRPD
jgi:hypothetical protein